MIDNNVFDSIKIGLATPYVEIVLDIIILWLMSKCGGRFEIGKREYRSLIVVSSQIILGM